MCDPFFTELSLMAKIEVVEEDLAMGKTGKAVDASWQKSTGQMSLHEMMHLNATSKGEPHSKCIQYLCQRPLQSRGMLLLDH